MYLKEFIQDEEGLETMEWLAILCVTAALIAIIAKVASSMKGKLSGLASSL